MRLWYTDSGGDGPPLVLLHAASGTSDGWGAQIAAFSAAGYRCIAYDRRGWGRSEPAMTGEQPGCASADLHALVERLALEDVHLVATAAGGAVAVDYALSHPERVRSLVLACCTGGIQESSYLEAHRRVRPAEIEALPAVLREVGACYRLANPEGVQRWIEVEHASQHQGTARQRPAKHISYALLETLRRPVLAIAGGADITTPPALMRLFAAHIHDCQWALLPEAGHAAFWEQPEAWNQLVLEFLGAH